MKNLKVILFCLVALVQLAIPASMISKHVQTLKHGRLWKLRTAPVDPVDPFRGRYVVLRFDAQEFTRAEPLPYDQQVYAILQNNAEGFAEIERVETQPASGDNVIQIISDGHYNGKQRIRFPFDRFWMSEHLAQEAEGALASNSTRERKNAYVTIRVRGGHAVIEDLYVDDRPIVEYLRSTASP